MFNLFKKNQPTSISNDGLSLDNPILLSSIPSSYSYLNNITQSNKSLAYNRVGSTKNKNYKNPIDIYKFYKNGVELIDLYIYAYNDYDQEYTPEELK